MDTPYEAGAYYFPNYHRDPQNEDVHGPGWTEWELVRAARPRYPGHAQPKAPLWGFEDEADPCVMVRKIDAAADHGLNHFLFDWYWHETGPFLGRALDEGFLCAPNRRRVKFALMWANHDWTDIHPAARGVTPRLLYPGVVSRAAFDRVAEHVVTRYFTQPNYWRVDGRPYFSVYELMTLLRGLGGVEPARDALDHLRARARAAGLPGVHLNAVVWGVQILPGEVALANPRELLAALGIDSVTSYVWIHHQVPQDFPAAPYAQAAAFARDFRETAAAEYGLPYQPNVTMGWDPSPRVRQTGPWEDTGYPSMAALRDNTPAAFATALRDARDFLDRRGPAVGPKILSINAWNEWTEGSYLEPDTVHGLGYLEAIREVFGAQNR